MKVGRRIVSRGAIVGVVSGLVAAVLIVAVTVAVSIRAEVDQMRMKPAQQVGATAAAAPQQPATTRAPVRPVPSKEASDPPVEPGPVIEPGPVMPVAAEPAPVVAPAPSIWAPAQPPAPICPTGDVTVSLGGVTSRVEIPSNTGDSEWDELQYSATVIVTNSTTFPVTGGARVLVSGTPRTSGVDVVSAFTENTTLQPGESISGVGYGYAVRQVFDAVQNWTITAALGQYFFEGDDTACATASSTNLVLR